MQFAAGQCGLEHITSIHGAFGFAGANNSMQLINEQDHIAFLLGKIVEQSFQTLLKFTPEFGTGHQ